MSMRKQTSERTKNKQARVKGTPYRGNNDATLRLLFHEYVFPWDREYMTVAPWYPGNDPQDISGMMLYGYRRNGQLGRSLNSINKPKEETEIVYENSKLTKGIMRGFFNIYFNVTAFRLITILPIYSDRWYCCLWELSCLYMAKKARYQN